jgi:hypothetical protein
MIIEPAQTVISWSFLFDHLHLAFWAAALAFVWRFRHVVDQWGNSLTDVRVSLKEAVRIAMETHGITTQIRTNDLTHLAEDVRKQEQILNKHLEVLQSIDKNTAIVAERLLALHKD